MRSLTLKLTLAFLFVSIIGVALAAFFVRRQTQREFDQFVLNRYQIDLIDDLANYFEQRGDWQAINAIVFRVPGYRRGSGPANVPAPIILTNVNGRVVYGGRLMEPGQQLPEEELKKAAPIEVNDKTVGWVLFTDLDGTTIAQPESPEFRFLNRINRVIFFSALGAVVIALFVGVVLARTISQPVKEVTNATKRVAGGDLGYQVPVRTKDELGDLASSFNLMSADLAQANRQRRQMTADIAHDLRTPLSVILGYLEAITAGKFEASPETLEIMYEKARHLQHLIEDLRFLSLADAGELRLTRRPVAPGFLLEHTALAHTMQAQEKEIDLRVEVEDDLPEVNLDLERMTQVLSNLVSNALRYTPAGGEIVLSAARAGGQVLLRVSDTGSGISAEDLPHIFDRFYRSESSRPQNGDAGLGLAIAKSIVEAHDGTITAASIPGRGTTFEIRLGMER